MLSGTSERCSVAVGPPPQSVLSGPLPGHVVERIRQVGRVVEADGRGEGLDLRVPVLEQTARRVHPHQLEVRVQRKSGVDAELAGEVVRRDAEAANTDQYVVAMIQAFLEKSSSHLCVFEDRIHLPGEPLAGPQG